MGATLTKSGRTPVAGSHKIPDHWEFRDLLVLHGDGDEEPALRVCIRGKDVGDATYVDMKTREADRFARYIFAIAGYEVPKTSHVRSFADHWSVYTVRTYPRRLIHKICIFNHGEPVRCRATQDIPVTRAVELSRWLADRLDWDLDEVV